MRCLLLYLLLFRSNCHRQSVYRTVIALLWMPTSADNLSFWFQKVSILYTFIISWRTDLKSCREGWLKLWYLPCTDLSLASIRSYSYKGDWTWNMDKMDQLLDLIRKGSLVEILAAHPVWALLAGFALFVFYALITQWVRILQVKRRGGPRREEKRKGPVKRGWPWSRSTLIYLTVSLMHLTQLYNIYISSYFILKHGIFVGC